MTTPLPMLGRPPALPAGPAMLPDHARAGLTTTPFGLYVHVPFCATRCGYCDFNTYTSDELGPGANRSEYAGTAIAELRLAAEVLGPDRPTVDTVFVGGGTPTLLPAADLVAVLDAVRELFPVAADAAFDQQTIAQIPPPTRITQNLSCHWRVAVGQRKITCPVRGASR